MTKIKDKSVISILFQHRIRANQLYFQHRIKFLGAEYSSTVIEHVIKYQNNTDTKMCFCEFVLNLAVTSGFGILYLTQFNENLTPEI